MTQRTLEALSAVGLGVFLLCACMTLRCASAPVSPALAEIADMKKDGTLDPLPEKSRKRVEAVLEKSAASEAQALEQKKKAETGEYRVSLVASGLGGAAAVLFLLLVFVVRRKRDYG